MSVLLPLLGFRKVLDPAQAAPPVVFDNGTQRPESDLVGAVDAAGPLPSLHHEPGLAQHAQVLADRRPGDVELRRDLACGQLPVPDKFEDPQAAGRRDDLQRFHDAAPINPRISVRQEARNLTRTAILDISKIAACAQTASIW